MALCTRKPSRHMLVFICLVALVASGYYTVVRLKAQPSKEALLRRVRPNSTEDQQSRFLNTSSTSILYDIKAKGWKTERKSIVFNNSHLNESKRTGMIVPNVVHYVWLGSDLTFTFINYLSFRSVHRFLRPDYIFVYGEQGPVGTWWDKTVQEVDNIYHVFRSTPLVAPSGWGLKYKAHASDLLRTQIICEFGGIYLDGDVIVIQSFDPIRTFRTVMGREIREGICNGIIISVKQAPFIRMLLEQYKDYSGFFEEWGYRSVLVPHILAMEFPSLIHIEETRLNRPNWAELDQIFDEGVFYNWRDNYAIHLWVRGQRDRNSSKLASSPEQINCVRSTFGDIARRAYYGSATLRCT